MTPDLAAAAAAYRAARQAVEAAKAQVKASQAELVAARAILAALIVEEGREGTRMRDLAAETGLSRERIRQILRANGVDPDRWW